ncbi:MAG: SDR family oxidoreductase [Alphaproteobacteria bacterium]|nr:SDR family oxidoreductase [Alphaproteobacteria bacterium]
MTFKGGKEVHVGYQGLDLAGKAVLVTGANSGIGLGMAEGMAEAGADIAIWGQNPDKNRAAEKSLSRFGRKLHVLTCNVADEAEVGRAMEETVTRLGRLDACFANAGVSGRAGTHKSFAEMTTAEWRRVMSVNLDGVFYTFRAALQVLLRQGHGGSLVVTGSQFGRMGNPLVEHYAAAKAGVESMMRSMATEFGRDGIRCNTIVPGYVDTPLTHARINAPEFIADAMHRHAVARWGVPEDFAGIAVYLASDSSRWVTGQSFVIDGGFNIAAKIKGA